MSKYIDVYLIPIAEENVPAYKKLAAKAAKFFIKHGALSYREYVFSDRSDAAQMGLVPFAKAVKTKPGEVVIYAAVEFTSESHRNKVIDKVMKDPDMQPGENEKNLFNPKRMVYGGFKLLVGK